MPHPCLPLVPLVLAAVGPAPARQDPRERPTIPVEGDDLLVESSCRLVFPDEPIADASGDGVVTIRGEGVVVSCSGTLRGAPGDVDPDAYSGVGIRIEGAGVTLRGARVAGFRVGILAQRSPRLLIEGCDVSDNFRQRLRSTPAAEDAADWLWPHQNDAHEWRERYGAGICIEDSTDVVVRVSRARDVQNGLVLDRVLRARVYDNDFSFLSGWGIAMWRTSESVISRNALDFCVRGYSHGVYNRGQDSAGILMFEQCCDNGFYENSATHGGDGFFAFSGREALGEAPAPGPDFELAGRGNARNVLIGNDFSDAVAHGIETTFGFDNALIGNRLVDDGICGVWAGYSQNTLIQDNTIEGNGRLGYGLERGGVNIEHGRGNVVVGNRFRDNACGVHLWWDEDADLAATPWAAANGVRCIDNAIVENRFVGDDVAVHLRSAERTILRDNVMEEVEREVVAEDSETVDGPVPPASRVPVPPDVPGDTRPVGSRARLAGREQIVMTEWGPHDGRAPFLQRLPDPEPGPPPGQEGARDAAVGPRHDWRLRGTARLLAATAEGLGVALLSVDPLVLRIGPGAPGGLTPYVLTAETTGGTVTGRAVLADIAWDVVLFRSPSDPREDEAAWRKGAESGVRVTLPELRLAFGSGGPSSLAGAPPELAAAALPAEGFGTLASAAVRVPAGAWILRTVSDDGLRVRVDGETRIEDWTHHAPTPHEARIELAEERELRIDVEHFELDGWAVLTVELVPGG